MVIFWVQKGNEIMHNNAELLRCRRDCGINKTGGGKIEIDGIFEEVSAKCKVPH